MKTKQKNYLKILILAIITIISLMPSVRAAEETSNTSLSGAISSADTWLQNGQSQAGSSGEESGTIVEVGQVLVHIASWILVAGTVVIGIKYMLATPDQKAKLKTQLVGIVVATIVIYGAIFIWATLVDILQ